MQTEKKMKKKIYEYIVAEFVTSNKGGHPARLFCYLLSIVFGDVKIHEAGVLYNSKKLMKHKKNGEGGEINVTVIAITTKPV